MNYSDFQTAALGYLGRTNDAELAAQVPTFIAQAEARIYRDVRAPQTIKSASLVIDSDGKADVPDDYMDLRSMLDSSGKPMARADLFWVRQQPQRGALPHYFARDGASFIFAPAGASTASLSYFARLPALSGTNDSNWLTDDEPDLLLAGILVEANTFTADGNAVGYWNERFALIAKRIDENARVESQSGSPPVMHRA